MLETPPTETELRRLVEAVERRLDRDVVDVEEARELKILSDLAKAILEADD